MTGAEALRQSAEVYADWNDRYADKVPTNPDHRKDGKSDYEEHHADRSAPAALQDRLNSQLMELANSYRNGP